MPKSPAKTDERVASPRTPLIRGPRMQPQNKSMVAQRKVAVSAQSVKTPVAPPPYRPVTKSVAQAKTAGSSRLKTAAVAPPVYRPHPTPKVLQPKAAPHQAIQRKVEVAAKPKAQKQLAAHRGSTSISVIQRAKPSPWKKPPAPAPSPAAAAQDPLFPPLGFKVSAAEQEEIRQKGLAAVAVQKEKAEKEAEALAQRRAEIESRDKRETWWGKGLLDLNEGSAGNKITNFGSIDGTPVHITVVKARTTDPNFRVDSVQEIVDKIIGPDNGQDTVHATLEVHGPFDQRNPHYYRNGDSPNCDQNQLQELRKTLVAFIVDATRTVRAEKQRLLGQ